MNDTNTPENRTLYAFENTSLNGFFEGLNHDISWHNVDEEFNEFAAEQLDETDCLLFGRVTYELMASHWPNATEDDPLIAERMNNIRKIVFSTTLTSAHWDNTTVVSENIPEEVSKLKRESGGDLAIFGSSDLAVSLLEARLIDELRVMVNPVILGEGKSFFSGVADEIRFDLIHTRGFESGNVLLTYRPTYGDEM